MSLSTLEICAFTWLSIAIAVHVVMFFVTAPFGRHSSKNWGPMVNNKLGWIIMELPSLGIMCYFLFFGSYSFHSFAPILFACWIFHYLNRTFIYPFRIKATEKKMPLFIVLRSIYSYHHGMHRESWNFESAVKLLASHRWTEEVIKLSICHNPGPPFEALPFVSGVVFDNFTIQVDYKSLHDLDHNGYRLDMTNWGSVTIPQAVAPTLNIAAIIGGKYE